ncbi:glycosyltransferase [Mesobacillus boroniphilus]|uniref:Glycosyltransferase n=1 Tax=Mesobacillus boroniphilus TaxID=308892 RepID=A0A944CMD5_9BACI|nr:glycosyltransferase family 4 protein [Mesobacillus boroniphilus]MBS8265639.1 glycosyltransferase [Mesobacillus boroniphilus]
MKVSFFHDAKLIKDKSSNYYSIGFTYNIWKRYLSVFDELMISTRIFAEHPGNVEEEYKGYQISSGENVFFSPISEYIGIKDILTNYSAIRKQIRNSLKSTDGAIIRLPSIIGILACREANKLNKTIVIETVGCSWDAFWNYGSLVSKVVAGPMFLLQRKYTKSAPFVIYITKKFLQNRYPSKGVNAEGVSNVMVTTPNSDIFNMREQRILNLKRENKLKIGLIGSLNVNYKGHETAIKALSYLKNKGIKAELYFVGGGDPARWKKIAEQYNVLNNINFIGVISSGEKVNNWLDEMDIYIQPSKAEGQGRALIEAVSRGCICFGSSVGGITDTLDEEFLFHPKKFKNLAKLIIRVLDDHDFAIKNIKRNVKNISAFNKEIIEEKRNSILNDFRKSILIDNNKK